MKTLEEYYSEVRKEHTITMRFAFPLTEEMLEKIELHLKKYDLISITAPKETIFQSTALGFAQPVNSSVTIMNATLAQPVSDYQLMLELARCVKVSHIHVVVNNSQVEAIEEESTTALEREPVEVETYVGKQTQIKPDDIKVDHSKVAGTEYNEEMIKTLSDARKEIKKNILPKV